MKTVATFVLLLDAHLTLWDQYSVMLVFVMPLSYTMHTVERHYQIAIKENTMLRV